MVQDCADRRAFQDPSAGAPKPRAMHSSHNTHAHGHSHHDQWSDSELATSSLRLVLESGDCDGCEGREDATIERRGLLFRLETLPAADDVHMHVSSIAGVCIT